MLDGKTFAQMIHQGAYHLTNNAKKIDELNVFPVPDGDTGTNMNLSMTSGANEVKNIEENSISMVADAFSKGLLMGARGNSGVILSQLFRGFGKAIEGKEKITPNEFALALTNGVKTAYKAVMKPVEGTVLTVARDAANVALEEATDEMDITLLMEKVLHTAKESLEHTPELLPVLKEVGVVDSGGQGLVVIYEGFLSALRGDALPVDAVMEKGVVEDHHHHHHVQDYLNTEDIKFGYCTEFMVKFSDEKLTQNPFDEDAFRDELAKHGDSLLVVSDNEIVKVHVHVEYPGEVLSIGQRFGSLINMKIENMREQHTAIVAKKDQSTPSRDIKEYAVIAVVMGQGIKALFEDLGVAVIIEGGQTMNPSTQDFTNAIIQANAKQVFILPNNKNVVMAAEQAAELQGEHVAVVPTKTIPEGIGAMLAFSPSADLEKNQIAMTNACKAIKSGQVTYAVRDTVIDGISIEKGHYMGIANGKIKTCAKHKTDAAKQLLHEMVTRDDEIITILSGEDVEQSELDNLVYDVEKAYEDIEIEVHTGNQPVYAFIIAVE